MDDDRGPRCTIDQNVVECINCESTNLGDYVGDVYGSKLKKCNDCNTSFGRCKYCDACVKIDDFVEFSGLSDEISPNQILEKFPNCTFDGNTLRAPEAILEEIGIDHRNAYSGSWTNYCSECERLLLVSIWFFGGPINSIT